MTRRYTQAEEDLLKRAVENGKKEGKNNTEIAELLVKNEVLPDFKLQSIKQKISNMMPTRRNRKPNGGVDGKIRHALGLMKRRESIRAYQLHNAAKLKEIDEELARLFGGKP
jgi:hypothetical protein